MEHHDLELVELEQLLFTTLQPGRNSIKVALLVARASAGSIFPDESSVNAALMLLALRKDIVVDGADITNWRGTEIRRITVAPNEE